MFDEYLLYQAVCDEDEDQVKYLLHEKKVDPNPQCLPTDADHRLSPIGGVDDGGAALVEPMLNPCVPFNDKPFQDRTSFSRTTDKPFQDNALSMACSKGNLNIVRLLITNKHHPADPNKVAKDWLTPFHKAVNTQNLDLIKLLLNESCVEVDLSVNHYHACTPLAMAVRQRNIDVCRLLLEHGSDANDPMTNGFFADICNVVQYAAWSGWSHIVKLLLKHGADITSAYSNFMLFRKAMQSGNTETVECCLQHAYSKLKDSTGCWHETLVDTSICTESEAQLLLLLLLRGLIPKPCKRLPHKSAFHIAAFEGSIISMSLLEEFDSQCLQEGWLVNGEIPNAVAEHQPYMAELLERRKQPPFLLRLCRDKIYQHLGYNPVQKAEMLPLPRTLKDFIQFKNKKFLIMKNDLTKESHLLFSLIM